MSTNFPSPGSQNLWNHANPEDQGESNDQINNQNMQTDYDQWYSDEQTMQQDEESLATAIADLVNVSHGHNYNATFEAMMMFFTQVFPDVLNIQQDQLNTLSDTQNISSDLRSFVTSIQNDSNTLSGANLYTNTPSNGNPSWSGPNWPGAGGEYLNAAHDFYGNTCDLYAWAHFLGSPDSVQGLSGANAPSSALSSSDAEQITGYSVSIANEILNPWSGAYASAPAAGLSVSGTGANILTDNNNINWMNETIQNPSSPNGIFPNVTTPHNGFNIAYVLWLSSQNISYNTTLGSSTTTANQPTVWTDNTPLKDIQQDLQQDNSSTSSLATTTQTTEQFYTNQYNQLTGIDNSMQQNFVEEISAIIQNESPNG